MFGFKKKSGKEALPPLPEDLPPIEPGMNSAHLDIDPGEPPLPDEGNIHDQIPNDIELGKPPMLKPSQSVSRAQQLQDMPAPPNPDNFSTQVPEDVTAVAPEDIHLPDMPTGEPDLPQLPEMPEESITAEEPMPQSDEDVPAPPAIFSDTSFYETPDEIKHLIKERQEIKARMREEKASEDEDWRTEAPGSRGDDKPIKMRDIKGPLFVDIESFRTMLTDIETVRNDIKTSEIILQHLQEIKNSKDKELERWVTQLEDIQKKINYVDKVLFNEA